MNDFMKAINFRHACKLFDEEKNIPDNVFDEILEAGRLSPSSFGLEPWHFLVVKDPAVKKALRAACWDQAQITTCSHLVVLLARKPHHFQSGSAYLHKSFSRRAVTPEKLSAIYAKFEKFTKTEMKPDLLNWAKMQTYIAGAQMMLSAAYLGVDTCPIEGFSFTKLTDTLSKLIPAFDQNEFEVSCCITFGYRANEQTPHLRLPQEEAATFV